jgi:hypothetical protein
VIFSEDWTVYMRVLLTDPRGWNVRNNLCHGMLEPDEISDVVADRIFHVLLMLALVRLKEELS